MHGDPDVISWASARSVVSWDLWCGRVGRQDRGRNPRSREFGDDAELESDIEAIVGALELMEESDAIEVLATCKTDQDGHGPRKAQSGPEDARTPTLEQHADSQKRSETRSRKVGGSHSVLQLSTSWSFQSKLSKETRPSTGK